RARRRGRAGRRSPQRDRETRDRVAQGLQAVIGVVGLGYWGPNLARNFAELGALSALCDVDPALRERFVERYPRVRMYGDLDELLHDDAVEGVVIATPVPTHYPLTRSALA